MSKEKFDLSNTGGQPKDWMQREHEKRLESEFGLKDLLGCAGIIVTLVACIALFAGSFFIDDLPKPLKATLISVSVFLFIFFAVKEIRETITVRREEIKRAIDNTWSRLVRVEGELREAARDAKFDNQVAVDKLDQRVKELEGRIRLLEQRDADPFGDHS